MTMITSELTVLPPKQPLDDLTAAITPSATLVGPDGRAIPLPDEVVHVLSLVVTAMANGQAVTIAPHHQTLTTAEAARILGISRPTFIRLLDSGRIPYEQPGRHRRVLLRDVLSYADTRRHQREQGVDALVDLGEEAGLYAATDTPRRTR
ncbi:helix-turn-helix domain-containing protein [Streptomyces sp. KLOTTS4A1]|uniref:helix-turn-helix domain-containing protein n=1 Tax=Streptomyces sp. KLOTTS4A1 TaxID=3390996 RepID=UPI0039F47C3C